LSDLTQLLHLIEKMPAYHRLREDLQQVENSAVVVLDAARPYLVAALYRSFRRPVLVITARPENAKKLYEQLAIWSGTQVKLFPEPDTLPYEHVVSDAATALERVRVLSELADCNSGEAGESPPLIVVSAPSLMGKVLPHEDVISASQVVKTGMDIEPFQLLRRWQAMGYRQENLVEVPGTMSHRGGIIDVYPLTGELPARLEFYGNTVDNIRLFEPASQRSVRAVDSVAVGAAGEMLALMPENRGKLERVLKGIDLAGCTDAIKQQFQEEIARLLSGERPRHMQFYAALFNNDSILDYLPRSALIMLDEPASIEQAVAELDAEAEQMRLEKLAGGELPRNFPRPYFTWQELAPLLAGRQSLAFTAFGAEEASPRLDLVSAPNFAGQLPSFIRKMAQLREQKQRIIIVSNQADRLSEVLGGEDIIAAPVHEVSQPPPPGSLTLVHGSLAEGWVMNGDTCLLTDAEIFGFVKQRREVKRHAVPHHQLFVDINPGDYVVHVEHGIASFSGVATLSTASVAREYLVLQYAAGDKLYVPTDQIDRISRYIGAGDKPPTLSRLGTQEWYRTRQKAEEAAAELAQELLALYASREVVPGFAFARDTLWQQELEGSFPYVETPDQLSAQDEVKADMEKTKPMDRLVCGDVGYGKTEVAIRAAFKAVMENRQVAVLVPTTVLAEQHLATFTERLNAFPVKIEALSRFRSAGEQRVILDGLAAGMVDICIGTHRLLQKDVAFKDLGLLIIDEEQRFGVTHKEYLKKMRREVDVLTLSATPIPRTLHMSLVGVRDMSTMETPPEERLPVKTYVAEYNERLVREAILRELERNGQVFFVHNRVQSIAMVADRLQSLVPEAVVAIGHGQMPEDKLEEVVTDFSRGRVDILVCTTIIESGLDMPNVNTIIVNQADKFGLTQLYQLRGRVGRGANLAYAYFLYDGGKQMTPIAQKRLRTIFEAAELGAGFNIAMKDLEIRGAGTLLGARQSGHISAVGFSLYCRLLADAVEQQKAIRSGAGETPPRRLPAPAVDLPLPAYIPEDYVADVSTRLELYQKLVKLAETGQVADMAQEFTDRFGAPPLEVDNLLYAVKIKILATGAGIESILTEGGRITIRRFAGMPLDHHKLEPLAGEWVKIGNIQMVLNYRRLGKEWREVLEEVLGGLT